MGHRDALVVGINQYPSLLEKPTSPPKHLKTPATDAEAIAQLLEKYGGFEVQRLPAINENGRLRVDSDVAPDKLVSTEKLQQAITELFKPKGQQVPDTALLFFAGHGLRRSWNDGTEGYLATSDANPRKDRWGVSLQWLRQILDESPIRQQIIWLDCCHSGELLNFSETDLAEYKKERDRCFIVASRDFQVAYAQAGGEHGVLSGALLQGLDPTLQSDKWVTNFTLINFVRQALKDAPQHPTCNHSGGEIIFTGKQSIISSICPYKGLAYFGFNDEDPKYFYGRTTLTNQLLEKLRHKNFIAVLGASGSGKSSVVRAGLLHQLKFGAITGSDRWKIYEPFTPGEHPLQNLEQVVNVKADQLQALINAAAADRVVLVIDQFEEVFTLCRDDAERQKFFEYLLGAVKQLRDKLCLVLVMRADFQSKCAEQEYAGLATEIDQNLVRVMPMSQEELKEAITKPAAQVNLEIDRELVNQMIKDVFGSPGDLPLLQYTLTELWEQRSLNLLTINDYTRLGGVKKALEKHANEVYQNLSTDEQLVAKQIFLELTHLGEGTEDTRQQVCQHDLVTSKRSPELVEKVVQLLAKEKLIITGEQEFEGQRVAVVNIAHEALIRNWNLLGKWLNENRQALLRKQNIEEAARNWRENRNRGGEAYLLQGTRLATAEDYLQHYADTVPLSGLAQEFVQKSIKHRQMNRRKLIGTISAVFLGLSGLTVWALVEGADAQIRADSASSESLFASDRKLESLVASLRATKRLKSLFGGIGAKTDTQIQAVTALRQAVSGVTELNCFDGHDGAVFDISISPDGKLIASAGKDGTVKLWTIEGNFIKHFYTGKTNEKWLGDQVYSVNFSPDGKLIAFADHQDIKLMDRSGNIVKGFQAQGSADEIPWAALGISSVSFSPEGQVIVSGDSYAQVRLHSLDGVLLTTITQQNWIGKVVFSPNKQMIASYGSDGFIRIYDRVGNLLKVFQHYSDLKQIEMSNLQGESDSINLDLSFSPDSQTIASTGSDVVKIWKIDGTLLTTLSGHKGMVRGVSFSPDGQLIASASSDNTAKIWRIDGKEIATIHGHTGPVNKVRFTPDGQKLVTASSDGTIRTWNLKSVYNSIFKNLNTIIITNDTSNGDILKGSSIEFSPDGKIIARLNADKTVSLWSINGKLIKTLQQIDHISFSPDGQMMAAFDDRENKSINIWKTNGSLVKKVGFSEIGYRDVKFSPKEKVIGVAGMQEVQIFDHDGKLISKFEDKITDDFRSINFSHDGRIIVATAISNTRKTNGESNLKLWRSNGSLITSIAGTKASISPDNKLIVVTGEQGDGAIRLFNINGSFIRSLTGHSKNVNDIQFSPDGRMIASASDDNTVKIWSSQGALIETLEHTNPVSSLRFSPDGKTLATAVNDGTVLFWNLDLDDLLARGCDWARNYLENNKNISAQDRDICKGIRSPK